MNIKCCQCEEVIYGTIVGKGDQNAIAELLSQFSFHCSSKHSDLFTQFQESIKIAHKSVTSLFSWMLFIAFIDIESPLTSEEILEAFDELDENVEPLKDILLSSDETENVNEEVSKEIEEPEKEVNITN